MNIYREIRTASDNSIEERKETRDSLEELRKMFLQDFDCSEIVTREDDHSYFILADENVRRKDLKYTITYVHETNKVELYVSGNDIESNDQVKALLGLDGGTDWIYMFVLSEDYETDEEDENEDIFGKAMSYIEFIEDEIEDIV